MKRKREESTGTARKKFKSMIKKKIKSIGVETKFKDNSLVTTSVTASGRVDTICNIPQGIGSSQRIGLKIKPLKLHFRITSVVNTTAIYNNVRLMIFQDLRQVDSSIPNITEVLESTGSATSYLSYVKWSNKSRWKQLYNKVYALDDNSSDGNIFDTVTIKNLELMEFSDASLGSINKNGLFVLLISDSLLNTPVVSWSCRLTYTDA